MKRIIFLAIIAVLATNSYAQKANWKEMHSFHAVMGATFHPAEEGNLKPIKDSAAALLKQAKLWQNSAVPQGYNQEVVKPILKKLVAKCAEVNKAVQAKADDKTITKLITEAHDIFHEIMEKCRPGKDHQH